MYSKLTFVAMLLASVEARFGQEQSVANLIQGLSAFGNPGAAGTLSGATPGVLLAGANACAKLSLADKIVSELGNDPKVLAAAAALVGAEKNFNPFVVSIPSICSDANLPATAALRGIVPLVDPAVTGANTENANAASSLKTPFNANGLSVADVMKANGFSNFTLQGSDGSTAAPAAGGAVVAAPAATSAAAVTTAAPVATKVAASCAPVQTITTTVTPAASVATQVAAPAATEAAGGATGGAANNSQDSSIAGLDFGLCVPTIKFVGGLGNRPATEFTFQAIDALVAKGQQEALNPNIITNRICDQLTNVCEANAAAKTACLDAKAKILALGTRNADTANTWNTLLGFAGTDINP